MKSKNIALITLFLIIILITTQAFAIQQKTINMKYKATTEKEKAAVERVERRLNDAWDDIKQSFNIDDTNYAVLNYVDDIPDFYNGKYPGYTDKELIKQALLIMEKMYTNPPKGSTIPVVLISPKMDEVIVCYKEADGTNVFKRAVKVNSEWLTNEMTKKGRPILK